MSEIDRILGLLECFSEDMRTAIGRLKSFETLKQQAIEDERLRCWSIVDKYAECVGRSPELAAALSIIGEMRQATRALIRAAEEMALVRLDQPMAVEAQRRLREALAELEKT